MQLLIAEMLAYGFEIIQCIQATVLSDIGVEFIQTGLSLGGYIEICFVNGQGIFEAVSFAI